MLYYNYTQTFSLILLYCWCSYCVSFCVLLDGICLSGNKRITYFLTFHCACAETDIFGLPVKILTSPLRLATPIYSNKLVIWRHL